MAKRINGIQQLGVGVTNVKEGFNWYAPYFGMDVKMFEEAAIAELMLPHTAGQVRPRHAILALNMQGGGGFEIWQHTGKTPDVCPFQVQLGDFGITIGKLKSDNLHKTYQAFQNQNIEILTQIAKDPSGNEHFYLKDVFGNIWEVVYDAYVLKRKNLNNGGIYGAVIGVKNMDESLKVYKDILNYDRVIYDVTDRFDDWAGVPGCNDTYRRVLLTPGTKPNGAFSPMLGPSQIELVQVMDREARDAFEGRIWGDPGFIHLCFDINGMDDLRIETAQKGFPFTVDSATKSKTFDMGEAAGSFAYIQAPEGTLIEFVETHKIPLLKKLGWYLHLDKYQNKPLPMYVFSLFGLMRVKKI